MDWINVGCVLKTNYPRPQFLYQPTNPLYYKYKGLVIYFKARISSVIGVENADVYDIGQSCH
jgi:hypothetical protein